MSTNERILIIGGGPVGTVTGLALARAGIPVTVFDRLAVPAADHRAATLQPSTLDLFAPLGLTDEILRQGIESPVFQWRDRVRDEIVAEFDYRMLAGESDYPYVIQLEQHKTIQIALDAALAEPLFNLVRPVDVVAVRQDADWVEADVKHDDGSIETHRGRWLIGCDGGRSLVRKSIGASFEGFTWAERFNIVATNKDFEGYNFRYRNYCAHPDRWCALMKVPGENHAGVWRCLFPAHEDESDEYVMSDAWIRARFAECLPGDPDGFEILHRNMYTVQQRVAGNFRGGRMILAGDAAHVNNPVGGMGMNSGFQDGLNLAGKLVEIWQGAPADPLLERYDRQRRLTAIKYVQAQSIANKKTLDERDPAMRQQKLDDLRRQAADPVAALEFVRRASLVSMYRESESIQ
jgi:3-(3-hydroxy-phenyl)propionate hydroxylase